MIKPKKILKYKSYFLDSNKMSLLLYEHQNIALPILKQMEQDGKGGMLADECGLGKTITISIHLMQNKIPNKCDLIVCPLSLMKQWKKELKRVYGHEKKPKILLFHGPNRVKKLDNKNLDFIITTYSILGLGQLKKLKWGRVILDESHSIRNGLSAKKPKAAAGAFSVGKRAKYKWCLSATPFCNRMNDIASQCKFIGTAPYNDPNWWKNEGKDPEEVQKWRNKFVLRRTKENIIKPPIYHDIDVNPTLCEVLLVEKIREKAQNKFESWKLAEGLTKIKLQAQILSLIQKLRIISDSYYSGEDKIDTDVVMNENSKVNVMLETLDRKIWDDPTHSVVIFSQFTSYLNILEKVINENMVGITVMKFNGSMSSEERDKVVKDFTTESYPRVLLISLMAGGVGLNLMPCSTVFLSEPYYNPFLEKQAEDRVHRLGQNNQVNVYRFSMKNSVETWINRLKQKKLFIASGLDLLSPNETPPDFSFSDLSELFKDLVGFQKTEEDKEKRKKNKNNIILDAFDGVSKISPPCMEVIGIDCSICLDDVGTKHACNLGCGHLFHTECINEWKNINDSCPMCKRSIKIL